jgi:hypothetical protein
MILGDTSTPAAAVDYVYDPFTGLPIADPSGSLQQSGYETVPADAALAVGNAAAAGVKNLFSIFKIVLVGGLIVGGVVVAAEATKLSRDAFGGRRR